jgi:ubiquinone/menaquinone biosynthesis C-methylase UbiE
LKHRLHHHPSDRYGDFEAWSHTYDSSALQRLFFDRVHARVVRELRASLRGDLAPVVLDAGCGTGRLLVRLRAAFPGASLIGIDAAAGMIEVASRKPELQGVRLEVATAEALPLEDASCDVVVSTVSFHHWSDQAAGLREVARVLRPGGSLLLVDAWSRGPYRPLMRMYGRHHGLGFRSDAEIVGLLHGASLRPRQLVRVGPPASPLGIMVAARP